jgi:hypothetical protein
VVTIRATVREAEAVVEAVGVAEAAVPVAMEAVDMEVVAEEGAGETGLTR